jgi:hypothetical protein
MYVVGTVVDVVLSVLLIISIRDGLTELSGQGGLLSPFVEIFEYFIWLSFLAAIGNIIIDFVFIGMYSANRKFLVR